MINAFQVRSYEADSDQQATIQTICNYFQEMAWRHAKLHRFDLLSDEQNSRTWVLLRLHVHMDTYPCWGDTIHVATWSSGMNRLYAYRDYELYDADGQRIGCATSQWIIIDINRRRPQRLPANLISLQPANQPRTINDSFSDPIPEADRPADQSLIFNVRLSDIDVNRHVNNVNYIEWAIEAIPSSWRAGRQLAELEVAFMAESSYGDRITSDFTSAPSPDTALHRVYREADGKTLMTATTRWR